MDAGKIYEVMKLGHQTDPLRELSDIALHFVEAVEQRIVDCHAADTYEELKRFCNPRDICVGIKSGSTDEDEILWIIAPHLKKTADGVATVEFALSDEAADATLLYRFQTEIELFLQQLNHAMEAIAFRCVVIRLTNEGLCRSDRNMRAIGWQ